MPRLDRTLDAIEKDILKVTQRKNNHHLEKRLKLLDGRLNKIGKEAFRSGLGVRFLNVRLAVVDVSLESKAPKKPCISVTPARFNSGCGQDAED